MTTLPVVKLNINDVLKRLMADPSGCVDLINEYIESNQTDNAVIYQTCAVMIGLKLEINDDEKAKISSVTGLEVPQMVLQYLQTMITSSHFKKTIFSIRNLNILFPNSSSLSHLMGVCYFSLGQIEVAKKNFEKSIELNSDNPEALNNLALCVSKQGEVDQALSLFKRASELKLGYFDPINNVCDLLERTNRIAELEAWIIKVKNTYDKFPDSFKYYEAKLLHRTGDYVGALKVIEKVFLETLPKNLQIRSVSLNASIYEKLSEYNAAFFKYHKMNQMAYEQKTYPHLQSTRWFEKYKVLKTSLADLEATKAKKATTKGYKPVFFVGFPRSGTTLVDTILRSHSEINVVEEKPCLKIAKDAIFADDDLSYLKLSEDADEFKRVRERYLLEQEKYCSIREVKVTVDKFPLNLLEIPFIRKAFPNSKIILGIRHPLDCVLSSWIQDFEMNVAMAQFTDLEKCANLYDLGMKIFFEADRIWSLDYHVVKYESLISDFETEVRGILSYLGVEWEDAVNSYRETALLRGQINTPSYAQVINPIHQKAKFRHKNFSQYMTYERDKLKHWIEFFNYKI